MNAGHDVTFELQRLLGLAADERELLDAGDWEAALEVRSVYDDRFAVLEAAVQRGSVRFDMRHRARLERLRDVHSENLRIYDELRAGARRELGEISRVTRISGYAPLGPDGGKGPSFLDRSA